MGAEELSALVGALGEKGLMDLGEKVGAGIMRDVFAASALQGLVSRGKWPSDPASARVIAEKSYELADAMMKARAQ